MADHYINADSGDNSTGDGSSSSPWETLAYAYTQASDGDTIYVQAATATYDWTDLTPSNGITVSGVSGDPGDAIFDGGGLDIAWHFESDWTFENLTFRNAVCTTLWDGLWEIRNDANLTFSNCIIHDIVNNLNHDVSGIAGIIQFEYNDDTSKSLTLTDCLFYQMSSFKENPVAYSLIGSGSAGGSSTITRCTFDLSVYDGHQLKQFSDIRGGDTNLMTVSGCIFYSDTSIDFGDVTGGSSFSYNCYYNVTDKGGTGSITSDPLFVDAQNSNYKLRPTSPCIGTGEA